MWILETRYAQQLPNGNTVVPHGYRIPYPRSGKRCDDSFLWLTAGGGPELEAWRWYAARYLGLQLRCRIHVNRVILQFLERCIVGRTERFSPSRFFVMISDLPTPEDIYSTKAEQARRAHHLTLGDFLDWVLSEEKALLSDGSTYDWRNPYSSQRVRGRRFRRDGRGSDLEFRWILDLDPEMETWRLLAAKYTSEALAKNPGRWWAHYKHLGRFLDRYIVELNQPRDPLRLLHVDYRPPSIKDALSGSPAKLLHGFVKWILVKGFVHLEGLGRTVDRSELRNPFVDGNTIGDKSIDLSFSWLPEVHPQLEEWRVLGEAYTSSIQSGMARAMLSMTVLFKRIILPDRRYWSPVTFLTRGTSLDSSYWLAKGGHEWRLNTIRGARDFIQWILANHLSVTDENGQKVLPYEFVNPFDDQISPVSNQSYSETNKIPLPYRYIDECRRILNQGPSFRDWVFAHRAISSPHGGDWFEVPLAAIDQADADCVWEKREVNIRKDPTAGESTGKRTAWFLWSPVRAVALYIKLLLPLRTYQVRVLDSGEEDTFRFCPKGENNWTVSKSPLSKGTAERPHQRGVFRRFDTADGEQMTGFYINTNKTADIGKDGASRGYFIPWQYDQALQWLAKLRDWQEKYNPIYGPTSWISLKNRHIALKSEMELIALGESCFLFRDAGGHGEDRVKPIRRGHIEPLWGHVCFELEKRVSSQGSRLPANGTIRFARSVRGKGKYCRSLFPLHSLRVSLLTLFALDGGVPLVYLSKLLAGHARLLMTIYYVKPGIVEMTETMAEAMNRLGDDELQGEVRWLAEAAERDLEVGTAYNDRAALEAVLSGRPGAGWIWDGKGVCPVGRARCDDGGPIIVGKDRKDRRRVYGPVSGGPGNCVRCRFFVTGPAFLPGLVAHQNLLTYRFGELGRRYQELDQRISILKDNRDSATTHETHFSEEERRELCRLEVEFERVQSQIDQIGGDVVATHKLIQRSLAILNCSADVDSDAGENNSTVALVAAGRTEDIRVSLEEITELHQLSVLCENAVIYPESEDDSAIYRRSQLIDAALETRRLKPLLCRLSKEEQLRVGNHLMRFLSAHAGSLRGAVGILEGTERLGDIGLLTDAIGSAANQSETAKAVSLATLSGTVALNDTSPKSLRLEARNSN